jgi:hypothetical protein
LFAENIRMRVDDETPMLDVSVDLNKSLRSRSKGVNTYLDAKRLADDRLADFKSLKIDDAAVIEHIRRGMNRLGKDVPNRWHLHVALEGHYWFLVRPEYRKQHNYESLTFHVESVLTEPPPL